MQNKYLTFLKRGHSFLIFTLLVISMAVLQGCRSKKSTISDIAIKSGSTKEWLDSFKEKQFTYETLNSRIHVEISDNQKSMGSKVDLKIVKNKCLQLSIQPILGIEVFRIQFTPDSIRLLDRINKKYAIENYSHFLENIPVEFNFYNLQALFTNQLFLPGKSTIQSSEYNQFRIEKLSDYTRIYSKDRSGVLYDFKIQNINQLTRSEIIDPTHTYTIKWNYMDFRPFYEILFPMNMDVQILEKDKRKAGMTIRFSKIQTDQPINTEFSISSRYTRVDLGKIIESLLNKEKN